MSKSGVWRDRLALGFTPAVSVFLAWLICILAYQGWAADTQTQRIHYLGALSLALAGLMGLGGMWFQRTRVENIEIKGPGGIGASLRTEDDATQTDPQNH